MTAIQYCSLGFEGWSRYNSGGYGQVDITEDGYLFMDNCFLSSDIESDTGYGLLYDTAQSGDFDITVKYESYNSNQNVEKSGLVYWIDEDNYIFFGRMYVGGAEKINFKTRISGSTPYSHDDTVTGDETYIRLTRTTNDFKAYYSADGDNWTQFGSTRTVAIATGGKVGLMSGTGHTDVSRSFVVEYSNFTLDGSDIPFGGSILPNYYNFRTDRTGTGLRDWEIGNNSGTGDDIYVENGVLFFKLATSGLYWAGSTITGPYARLTSDDLTGEFDIQVRLDGITSGPAAQYLHFYVDDSNYLNIYRYNSNFYFKNLSIRCYVIGPVTI
jgi:regulation of enolase protein 1 (concanavalin A-like superfamily)